ncbi:EVE domain-containing protein [Pyrococcus kukulkanii]|uniref:EVE domain-containing protein n=1 Tax=Pyrococcus kukulkanii TaxID=1609559 RepID=UPI0035626780
MGYWLCITNRDNWEIIKEKNVWGVPRRHENTMKKIKPGDKLVIYVKQETKKGEVLEPMIVGIFEVVSEPYTDSTRIFKAHTPGETYPIRVKIRPLKIGEVKFKPLIPKLKFIKNKKKWSGHLMGKAMREIPEEDYRLIESMLG